MRFVVKDCDPTTGEPDCEDGYDDEYMLEDMEITVADQIQKTKKNNFQAVWDAADTEGNFFFFLIIYFHIYDALSIFRMGRS